MARSSTKDPVKPLLPYNSGKENGLVCPYPVPRFRQRRDTAKIQPVKVLRMEILRQQNATRPLIGWIVKIIFLIYSFPLYQYKPFTLFYHSHDPSVSQNHCVLSVRSPNTILFTYFARSTLLYGFIIVSESSKLL